MYAAFGAIVAVSVLWLSTTFKDPSQAKFILAFGMFVSGSISTLQYAKWVNDTLDNSSK